ncbi:hypothetical protein [Gordonia sp. (in: high G+C Gram-positive bacteria)]|uniref:hypothetical protein n=1 Tax=Gordonia sp. (in: high G+C Gram-positive bacteria) TaxID=84139 RepID=UPI003529167B
MAARHRLAVRSGLIACAVAVGAALAAPATTHAEPSLPIPGATGLDSLSLSTIPLDSELAQALRNLKESGADQQAIEALKAILSAEGSPDLSTLMPGGGTTPPAGTPTPTVPAPTTPAEPAPVAPAPAAAHPADDPLTTAATGLEVFEKLTGAKVLTPAFAPFCATPTSDNPLGLVTAPAVGVPGPFPKIIPGESVQQTLSGFLTGLGLGTLADILDKNQDLTQITEALNQDQTAYALVPPAGHIGDRFQVAWFNTATMKGGLADLKPIDQITQSEALKALVGKNSPVRLARVDTGQGSILTAVFGTTTNAGRTCYFLPAVGIVDTPAT